MDDLRIVNMGIIRSLKLVWLSLIRDIKIASIMTISCIIINFGDLGVFNIFGE